MKHNGIDGTRATLRGIITKLACKCEIVSPLLTKSAGMEIHRAHANAIQRGDGALHLLVPLELNCIF